MDKEYEDNEAVGSACVEADNRTKPREFVSVIGKEVSISVEKIKTSVIWNERPLSFLKTFTVATVMRAQKSWDMK